MLKQDRSRWYRVNLREFCVTMQIRSYNTIAPVIFESSSDTIYVVLHPLGVQIYDSPPHARIFYNSSFH